MDFTSGSKSSSSIGTATVRRYMKRGNSAPDEPTSTLVLTSPNGYFVDIRLLSSLGPQTPPLKVPLVRITDFASTHSVLPVSALDWAFAGIATSTPAKDGKRHCEWKHLIDSHAVDAESVSDKATCGAEKTVGLDGQIYECEIETGESLSAENMAEIFEEFWMPIPVLPAADVRRYPDAPADTVQLLPDIKSRRGGRCVVLQTNHAASSLQAQGIVVRVGDWCQGILRCREPDAFYAERHRIHVAGGDGSVENSALPKLERMIRVSSESGQQDVQTVEETGLTEAMRFTYDFNCNRVGQSLIVRHGSDQSNIEWVVREIVERL